MPTDSGVDSSPGNAHFAIVYDDLKRLAISRVSGDPAAQSLSATELVHEAYLRLANHESFTDKQHLIATTAEVMRRILIDRARSRKQIKHGGDLQKVDLIESQIVAPATDDVLLLVNEALEKLEETDPECANLVKLRFFSGFSLKEVAEATDISYATVKRRWAYAKAWLTREIGEQDFN